MFRFNRYYPKTCNTLPQCGEDCHDLNSCYNRATYVDSSGVSRYVFATFDEDWNLTCTSGEACNQDVFDLPPLYHRQYAPCCWQIDFTGGSGSGICGQSCDKNYSYLDNPHYHVELGESGTASVYFRSYMYGHGTGGCGTTAGQNFPFYSGIMFLGTISDPACGLDGRELSGVMEFTKASDAPSLCNYDDVTATYTALYSRQECTSTHISSSFALDWLDCLDVNTIIVSGWPGCYTQDGDFIELGDPYSNTYEISVYEAINFAMVDFEVQGITGHDDDLPEISSVKTTCYECGGLNRTWLPGDWNGQTPYDPKATCCKCPESDMCLTNWSIDLAQPSSIITLSSYAHGPTATWVETFPDSGCVIDPSGGSWTFEHLWQASPGSGDLPIESGFWNRCDFSASSITVNYSSDFIPAVAKSGIDCGPELGELKNGHCHICFDRNGPVEFLVTVDLNYIKNPAYIHNDTLNFPVSRAGYPDTSFDPPNIRNPIQCPGPIEIFTSRTELVGEQSSYCLDHEYNRFNYMYGTIDPYSSCDCQAGAPVIPCEPNCISYVDGINTCSCTPENINGAYIVTRNLDDCQSSITERGIEDCPCHPCESGLQSTNLCQWSVYPPTEGQSNHKQPIENCNTLSGVFTECPCSIGWVGDANNVPPYWVQPLINSCYGCHEDINYQACISGGFYPSFTLQPPVFGDLSIQACTRGKECLCHYAGPTVYLSSEIVSGVPMLRLTVSVPGYPFTQAPNDRCGASASTLLYIPFSGINQSFDCEGNPYGGSTVFDCSNINHVFSIPDTAIYSPVPWDSGTMYTFSCHGGGTITVESL